MDKPVHDIPEILVRYLDGELDATERTRVEADLAANASLAGMLEQLQQAREAVKWYGLKAQVAAVRRDMLKNEPAKVRKLSTARRVIRISLSAAAAVVFLFAAFFAFKYFTVTPEKVYHTAYQPYEAVTLRGTADAEDELLKAYRNKQYDQVLAFPEDTVFNPRHRFLRGISALETGRFTEAREQLKLLTEAGKTNKAMPYRDEADYYYGLACIRTGAIQEAREVFTRIKNDPAHSYHKQVTGNLYRQLRWLGLH